MGMLSAADLDMTPEELSKRIPGPGSYWYNVYKNEAPELLAAAEAYHKGAADDARGPAYTPPEPQSGEPELSYDERRYQELLGRGVIDEQGNILKPDGINMTEIMRGETPSWASPELIKNAYIHAFESKARGGQDFMDSGDYQNFLNAGYSLTEDQINSIGGVQGQGNQDDLTFGGGQTTTGVANPPPPPPANPTDPTEKPTWGEGDWTERESTYTRTDGGFMGSYGDARPGQPAAPEGPAPVATQKTPFADAYFKAMEAAKKKGPVSSMFAGMIPGE